MYGIMSVYFDTLGDRRALNLHYYVRALHAVQIECSEESPNTVLVTRN